jgi:hypothetical protein
MGFSAGLEFDVTGEGNVDTGKPGAGLIVPVVAWSRVFYRPDIARKRRGRTLTRVVVLRGQTNICADRRQRKQTFSRCA